MFLPEMFQIPQMFLLEMFQIPQMFARTCVLYVKKYSRSSLEATERDTPVSRT